MSTPSVLHLFANYKWTGPADPAIRSALRLRSLGLNVRFTQGSFMHAGGEHGNRLVAEVLWRGRMPVVTGLELRKHFHVPSLLRDISSLRRIIDRDGYDILHCHQGADHLIAAVACRRMPNPPVLVRSLYEPEPPRRGWRERVAFGRTQGVLAPTMQAQEGMRSRFAISSDDVLLQEPVTEPRAQEGRSARERLGLNPNHLVVGITARIQPHRRFDLLWKIVQRVRESLPEVRFVLLGRGNEKDTEELVLGPIAAAGIEENVLVPGYQKGDAYEEALRSFDAFLFLVPGSDGTCRAVCDAMAYGLPIVSTQRGILPELLAERRSGEVPGFAVAETAEALGTALLRLLQDESLRAKCSSAALRRTQLDMDPHAAACKTRDLYMRLLARRSNP